MAAGTPVIVAGVSGLRLYGAWPALKLPYSGADAQAYVRWQLSRTNAFPAVSPNLVWDTLLRAPDGQVMGADWLELYPEIMDVAGATSYYLSCMVRNGIAQDSAWATAVVYATAAAELLAVDWLDEQ